MAVPDKIERTMIFNASLDKVWDAITNPQTVAKWFANSIDVNSFHVGQEFTFTWVKHGYSRAIVAALDPKSHFAYEWENAGVDQSLPIKDVPKTLVTFLLEEIEGGVQVILRETGFTSLPSPKVSFEENTRGWDVELGELRDFLEAEAA